MPREDMQAVARVAKPGDSAADIVERLVEAGETPRRGGEWHRVRVHRVAAAMRRAMAGAPADHSEARRRRIGDVAVAYRRRGLGTDLVLYTDVRPGRVFVGKGGPRTVLAVDEAASPALVYFAEEGAKRHRRIQLRSFARWANALG